MTEAEKDLRMQVPAIYSRLRYICLDPYQGAKFYEEKVQLHKKLIEICEKLNDESVAEWRNRKDYYFRKTLKDLKNDLKGIEHDYAYWQTIKHKYPQPNG